MLKVIPAHLYTADHCRSPQITAYDRRSLQITADHLNMTAVHLCLICIG